MASSANAKVLSEEPGVAEIPQESASSNLRTFVRVKRHIDEDPATTLLLSFKHQKVEKESKQKPSFEVINNSVLKFAGSIQPEQEGVLNWLDSTSSEKRVAFLKSCIDRCTLKEIFEIDNIVNKIKNKLKAAQVCDQIQTECSSQAVENKSQEEGNDGAACSGSVPLDTGLVATASSILTPRVNDLEVPWWSGYSEDDIFSLDTEHVHYKSGSGAEKIKAATVSIVDFNGKLRYSAKIYHRFGSFEVNNATRAINGFEKHSFENGKRFKDVQLEVLEFFRNKLVILIGAESDWNALGISKELLLHYNIHHFDLHDHRKKPSGQFTKLKEPIYQPIGLRALYYYYFKKDLHTGVHTAESDARATMKLFRFTYQKVKTEDLSKKIPNEKVYEGFIEIRKLQ